jgi:hypothetical protein
MLTRSDQQDVRAEYDPDDDQEANDLSIDAGALAMTYSTDQHRILAQGIHREAKRVSIMRYRDHRAA